MTISSFMAKGKGTCDQCGEAMSEDLDVCPNCGHRGSVIIAPTCNDGTGPQRTVPAVRMRYSVGIVYWYSAIFLISFIAVNLFWAMESPVWPGESLTGIWYLDLIAISLIAFIIATAIIVVDRWDSK